VLDGWQADQALASHREARRRRPPDTEHSLCEVFRREQFNGVAPHIDDDFFALGLDRALWRSR